MADTALYHGWTHDEVYAFMCKNPRLTDAEIAAHFADRTEMAIALLRVRRAPKAIMAHEQGSVRVHGDDQQKEIRKWCTFETLLKGHARCPLCGILSCHGKGKSHCLLKKGAKPVVCDWCRERNSTPRVSLVTLCAIQSSMDFGSVDDVGGE